MKYPLKRLAAGPMPTRKWLSAFFTLSLISIGTVFSINYTIDPFGNRSWIVEKKYKPIVHERSEKYTYIFQHNNIYKYDCIILGSSRVMSIIPENHSSTQKCYNFGVHVANNPEKLFILQEWLRKAPIKSVYLGNELNNLHAKNQPLALTPSQFTQGSEGNYLSLPTLLVSIKSLFYALKNKPQTYFEADGSIRYIVEEEAIKAKIFDHSPKHFKQLADATVQHDYIQTPFVYEKKALEPLKQMKKLCDDHKIKLYPFITPTYIETQKLFQSEPFLKAESLRFRQDLTKIFGKVYDFDINHTMNSTPENFYDVHHYRPQIGNQIVDKIENINTSYGIIRLDTDFDEKGKK